jgi:preprotein translocase subunit SecG
MQGLETVLLVAYLLIVLAMIAVILLQRSEGGGLGMGGNAGGLISVRGSANLLTRTTAVLAALFFATAIGLTILSEFSHSGTSNILEQAASGGAAPSTVLDALNQMQADTSSSEAPAAPASSASAAPAAEPGLAVPVAPTPSAEAAPASSTAPAPSSEAPTSSAPAQ